jgi:ribosomal protein S18 acetylase RimI-like enzyme
MIHIQKAEEKHAEEIVEICRIAQWATYGELYSKEYIEQIINKFYTKERVLKEIKETSFIWGGWFVALENDKVVGAGGGGMTADTIAELYVLYLDPNRRNEGIGTMLLEAITQQQKELGAKEQWVSVAKGNQKGIPFYEARGFVFQHEEESYEKAENETYISLRYKRFI